MNEMQKRLRREDCDEYVCFDDYESMFYFNDNICHYGLLEDLTYQNCYGIEEVYGEMEREFGK